MMDLTFGNYGGKGIWVFDCLGLFDGIWHWEVFEGWG